MNYGDGILVFVVYTLATWRISSLLVNEGGPGSIFVRLRELSGITHDDDGNKLIIPDGFLPGVLSCIWCASIWVGGFWAGLALFWPVVGLPLAMVFSLSAGAILIERAGFGR